MIDSVESDRLLVFFENMLAFYKKFLKLETEKYNDLAAGRLDTLNTRLKQEQAFVLEARGMELKRQKMLEEIGIGKKTFREMIPLLTPEKQEQMQKLYEEISAAVTELRHINKRCNQLAKIKLGHISRAISSLENHPELKQIYGKKLQNKVRPEGTFSRKI